MAKQQDPNLQQQLYKNQDAVQPIQVLPDDGKPQNPQNSLMNERVSKKEPLLTNVDTSLTYDSISCQMTLLPSGIRWTIAISSFLVAILISYYAKSKHQLLFTNPEILVMLPIVISFSGTIVSHSIHRTLQFMTANCLTDWKIRSYMIFSSMFQSILIGVGISFISIGLFYVIGFHKRSIQILLIALPTIVFVATILGILFTMIVKRYFKKQMEFIGNVIIPFNDFVNTILYIQIAKFMIG